MATEKQIQANRNNAKQSTGPRTEQGKSRVSQNALKHGLLARDAVMPGEDPAEFEAQLAALEADIQPQGALECELVRQIADAQWRMRRLTRVETGYLAACLKNARHLAETPGSEEPQLSYEQETVLLGSCMFRGNQGLVHLARYDAHLGRRFERALQQIAKLREARKKRAQASPQDAVQTPPPQICETNPISPNQNGINEIAPISPPQPQPSQPPTHRNAPLPTGGCPSEDQIRSVNGAPSHQNLLSK